MIITISGFSACGKTTVGKLVAESLHLPLLAPSFKDLAREEGISLMEFQEKAKKDHNIDKKFDKVLQKQANENPSCVIATWLCPWVIKGADLKVWLDVSEKVRAARMSGREKISEKEAMVHLQKRDSDNIARYKKVYGTDITNHEDFDLIINSEKMGAKEVAKIIITAAKKKSGKK